MVNRTESPTKDVSKAKSKEALHPFGVWLRTLNASMRGAYTVSKFGFPYGFKDKYTVLETIGKGSQGEVFKCCDKETQEEYAVKIVKKRTLKKGSAAREMLLKEIDLLKTMKGCANVVQLHDVFEGTKSLYIVQELCRGSDLLEHISTRKGETYSEAEAAGIIRQILHIVADSHLRGVVHRDIKPANFLCRSMGDALELIAADFGFAESFKDGVLMKQKVGSPLYVAPEVLLGKGYGPLVDVWSVGVIMHILLSGKAPFEGETEVETLFEVMDGTLDLDCHPWQSISEPAKDLLKKLLQKDPECRVTASQALSHSWLKEGGAPVVPLDFKVALGFKHYASSTKGRQMLMSFVAKECKPEDVVDLHDQFMLMDVNNDGKLSVEEIQSVVERVASASEGGQMSRQGLRDILGSLDSDQNGCIEYKEFIAATLNWNQLTGKDGNSVHKSVMDAFKEIDKDGDGNIDPAELAQCLGEEEALDLMKEADTNGDGFISFREFCDFLRSSGRVSEQKTKLACA